MRPRHAPLPAVSSAVRLVFLAAAALTILSPAPAASQAPPPREALLTAARDIMTETRYCVLATLDAEGAPRLRTMDAFAPDDDMTVWLGTTRLSRKVQEIDRDGRVSLHFTAPGGSGYVSILGRARIVDDPAEKAARWKPEWEGFYSDREAEYVLIEVTPERLEILDYARGIVGDSRTWEPPSVVFR